MSRSEPKPKIIYKNLEDVIKGSSLNKNSSAKKHNTQRATLHTLADITNMKQSNSLELKKTKFIQINAKTQLHENTQQICQNTINTYTKCYNQIDAIFTEMEDFFCQSKQKFLDQIRQKLRDKTKTNQNIKKIKQKVQDAKKMSDYIKHIANYFINGQIPDLKQKYDNSQQNKGNPIRRPTSTTKNTMLTEQYDDQSSKLLALSMKNSKFRANRRGELMNTRKKSIYELILQQQENKMKMGTCGSKKVL